MEKIDLSDKIMLCFQCETYNYVSRLSRGMGINIKTGKSLVTHEIICVDCDGKGDGKRPDDVHIGKAVSRIIFNRN